MRLLFFHAALVAIIHSTVTEERGKNKYHHKHHRQVKFEC